MPTYYVAGIPYSPELYHFGIKGQLWGIRRYQNEDGTLTEEGKKRYRNNPNAAKKVIKENWVKSYNNAANEVNTKIPEFNKKWEDVDFKKDPTAQEKYEKEFWDMYNEIHTKHLEKDFGEIAEISGLGKEYLKNFF